MWIKYKVPQDMTLEEVVKKSGNILIDPILKHPKNRHIFKLYRKGEKIPKGEIVWVVDPKLKVYTMVFNGQKRVLTAGEYKGLCKRCDKVMDFAVKQYSSTHDTVVWRHNQRKKVNDKHWVVAGLASMFADGGSEPVKQKNASAAAVKALNSVVSGRYYGKFEAAVKKAARAVSDYARALDAWEGAFDRSAGNLVTTAEITRDVGFVTFGALATTVAAPATLPAVLLTGTAVGGGTAALSSAAEETGKHIAGQKVTFAQSVENVAWSTVKGAALGGISAGFAKWLGGKVAPKIAEKIFNQRTLNAISQRLVGGNSWVTKTLERTFAKEVEIFNRAAAKRGGELLVRPLTQKAEQQMYALVVSKAITRAGIAKITKASCNYLLSNAGGAIIKAYMKSNFNALKGVSEDGVADQIASHMEKHDVAMTIFDHILQGSRKELEAELRAQVQSELRKKSK